MPTKLDGFNLRGNWSKTEALNSRVYQCGYCDQRVSSDRGWGNGSGFGALYVCPHCGGPTLFVGDGIVAGAGHEESQSPGPRRGADVKSLPVNIQNLYDEIRSSVAANTHTGAVLLARKLLMHIAVAQGAAAGEHFVKYVEYLAKQGWLPPNAKPWVDHIRKRGNEANHEIVMMSPQDSEELLVFSEMLLRFIYEFPDRVPKAAPPAGTP